MKRLILLWGVIFLLCAPPASAQFGGGRFQGGGPLRLDGGVATTVHAAGANVIQLMRHATDCTAITDGLAGEACYELDANTLYICEPTAGLCDTPGEWIAVGGSSSAPADVGYWTDAASGTLTSERNLGALTTGLVLNTVTAGVGVPSAYGGAPCTNQFIRSLSASGAATCASVATTDLVSSTISGVSLGGTLADLTATNSTLTFSGTYTGATARTIGLNLGNANTWSALQTLSAGLLLGSDNTLAWGDAVGGGTADTWLSRISAGVLQHGLPDNSSPTAHILTSQGYNNAVATAGPLFTIKGSNGGLTSGTGGELRLQGGLSGAAAGTGGAITFYTAPLAAGTTPAARVTVLPSGNVGIGTTGPTAHLDVALPADNSIGLKVNDANGYGIYTSYENTLNFNYGQNAAGIGYINFVGYNNGATQFRDLEIANGKTGNIAYFQGSSGNVGIGTTNPASLLDLRSGDLTMSGANGQKYVVGRKTELTTIAAAATTATTITIPADAILKAVEMRVTVQPPGTATMVVTATTSGTVLQQGASMSTVAGTTDVGTTANGHNYIGVAAQTITITPDATPSDATGRVRIDLIYEQPTAATS